MNTAIFQKPTIQEETEIKAKIDDALVELKRLNMKMAQDRAEYERLDSEMHEIALESRRIMAQTQGIIAQLGAS